MNFILKNLVLKMLFFVQNQLLRLGLLIRHCSPYTDISRVIELLEVKDCSSKLVKIGGENDGSYFVPNVFDRIDFCVSPGVGPSSTFELELERDFQISSLMIDSSVDNPASELKNGVHIKKFLSAYTDDKNIDIERATLKAKDLFSSQKRGILQIDIEGSEFHSLLGKISHISEHYEILLLEIHFLDLLCFPFFLGLVEALLEEINSEYNLVYLNENTCCGKLSFGANKIARVIELSYLKKNV